jgi:hypothetical protein
MLAPFNLCGRARPSPLLKDRPVSLGEFAVEMGIMGDDDYGVSGKCYSAGNIDPLSRGIGAQNLEAD